MLLVGCGGRETSKNNPDVIVVLSPTAVNLGTLSPAPVYAISSEHFKEILLEAALDARKRLQILQENGHAPDHPVPVAFPEGRYLKFVLTRVLG